MLLCYLLSGLAGGFYPAYGLVFAVFLTAACAPLTWLVGVLFRRFDVARDLPE